MNAVIVFVISLIGLWLVVQGKGEAVWSAITQGNSTSMPERSGHAFRPNGMVWLASTLLIAVAVGAIEETDESTAWAIVIVVLLSMITINAQLFGGQVTAVWNLLTRQ